MGITVQDIEQKEFAYKGAGFDPYEVDCFLDEICDEMIAMQERVATLEKELEQAKLAAAAASEAVLPMPQTVVKAPEPVPVQKTSETLENILLSAQRISDEAVETAKQKAAGIVEEAENRAAEMLENVQKERSMLEETIQELKNAAKNYRSRFLSLLEEHKSLLETKDTVFDEMDD